MTSVCIRNDNTRERYRLPVKDALGFCKVLMAALGGDGANMAGKLLYKIGCTHYGLDGGYDAQYGSEKKGTATDVSVRFCEVGTAVRQSGPAPTADVLVVFHEDLIEPLSLGRMLALDTPRPPEADRPRSGGAAPPQAACQGGAVCIVNSTRPPATVGLALGAMSTPGWTSRARVVCLDATRIAFETGSRINIPLLAAVCREMGFSEECVKGAIAEQWPKARSANLAAFSAALSGLSACDAQAGASSQSAAADLSACDAQAGGFADFRWDAVARGPIGWRNMLNGGTVDALTHSTIHRDNRIAGRGRVPRFDAAACNSCGICLTVCSDPGGLLWREGRMEGIDEAFCKGCMRCVEVCPETKKGKALAGDGDLPAGRQER